MKIKVSEASGRVLDWMVAKCKGATNLRFDTVASWWFTLDGEDRVLSRGWSAKQNYAPSSDPAQGFSIIEQEKITLVCAEGGYNPSKAGTPECYDTYWVAEIGRQCAETVYGRQGDDWGRQFQIAEGGIHGHTALIAACRCYVASKMGEHVDVPDELVADSRSKALTP